MDLDFLKSKTIHIKGFATRPQGLLKLNTKAKQTCSTHCASSTQNILPN
jgi:hypothetical protein